MHGPAQAACHDDGVKKQEPADSCFFDIFLSAIAFGPARRMVY